MVRGTEKVPVTSPDGDTRYTLHSDAHIFGGTKRIALECWLPQLQASHFIYTGSVFGWGAPALAAACEALNLTSTLLIAKSSYTPEWLDLIPASSHIIWHDPAPVEALRQRALRLEGRLLPPGFDDPGFIEAIRDRASAMTQPARVWVPVVSGTLLRGLELAWPETEFHGVCVARKHGYTGRAVLYQAPEKYHQPALTPPPFPACPFSDAKLWQFVRELAKQDDLIWVTNP